MEYRKKKEQEREKGNKGKVMIKKLRRTLRKDQQSKGNKEAKRREGSKV